MTAMTIPHNSRDGAQVGDGGSYSCSGYGSRRQLRVGK